MLELGPHKDREKLRPGWDLNPRPSDLITITPPTELPGQNGSRPWVFEVLIHKDKFGLVQVTSQ